MAQRPVVEHLVKTLSRCTITAPTQDWRDMYRDDYPEHEEMEHILTSTAQNYECGLITSLLAKLEGEARALAIEVLAADTGAIKSILKYLRHHGGGDQERAFIFATFDTMTLEVLMQNLRLIVDAFNYLWNRKDHPDDRPMIRGAWSLITDKTTPEQLLAPCVELARETIERMAEFDDTDAATDDHGYQCERNRLFSAWHTYHDDSGNSDAKDNWEGACPLFGFLEPKEQALILTPFAKHFVSMINRRIKGFPDSTEGPREYDLKKWSRLFSHLPMTIQLQYRGSIEAIIKSKEDDDEYYEAAEHAEKIIERWNRFIRLQEKLCRCPSHKILGDASSSSGRSRRIIFGFLKME